jgi:hypothetical protein
MMAAHRHFALSTSDIARGDANERTVRTGGVICARVVEGPGA